jgi:hypothetical protein
MNKYYQMLPSKSILLPPYLQARALILLCVCFGSSRFVGIVWREKERGCWLPKVFSLVGISSISMEKICILRTNVPNAVPGRLTRTFPTSVSSVRDLINQWPITGGRHGFAGLLRGFDPGLFCLFHLL